MRGIAVLVLALLVTGPVWAQPETRPAASAEARSPRTVLAVYSSAEDFPGNVVKDSALRKVLLSDANVPVDYHTEYLESDRFPAEDASLALREYIRHKYRGRHIDVVVAINEAALDFVVRFRHDLFAHTPIVFWSIEAPDARIREAGAGITGVAFGRGYESTLNLALKLHPATERLLVVVSQTLNPALDRLARRELDAIGKRVAITYITGESLPDLINAVKAAPPRSLVFYARHPREDPGQVLFPFDVAGTVAKAAPVPTYVNTDSYIGTGAIGGAVFDTGAIAATVGEMARQILSGTRPQDIPLVHPARVARFDWRALQRWNIRESALPEGSTVVAREPGAWELYRPQIIAGVLIAMLQTAFIGALLVQSRRRMRAQRALRESEERFRLLADTAPVLVWRTGADGRYDFVNRPWLEFTGRAMEQELGDGWRQGLCPDDLEQYHRTYTAALEARQPFNLEYRLRRADGAYRWVLDTGVPRYSPGGHFAGYIGSCLDITDRKNSENALRDSQKRYTMATAAGAVGVWDWNFDTGEIYVDPILKSILGFTDTEITSRSDDWGARVYPGDLALVTQRVQACMESDAEYDVEHRMIHKDGTVRWFLSRGSLLRHPDGRPHRMVGTKVDITERKRAEEAIREQEAVLRMSDLEIQDLMGRLIAAQEVERARIARDLHDDTSQQLAGLAISLSGIRRRVRLLSGDEELLLQVSAVQQRTIALAGSVRQISHDLHPSTLKHVGLVNALSGYCGEVRKLNPVDVTFSSEGDFESFGADAALCVFRIAQEALRNVVAHADAARAEVSLVRIDDSAALTITDDGKGFDLVSVRESRSGLGLVSINERVRLAGGTMQITTGRDRGTRVRVRIPANQHPRAESADVRT